MVAEDSQIVILLDNASSHVIKSDDAALEDLFGFRTRTLGNIWLMLLPPNTTAFTQPLDQGLNDEGALPSALASCRHGPVARCWCNACDGTVPPKHVQRHRLPLGRMDEHPRADDPALLVAHGIHAVRMDLAHVGLDGLALVGNGVNAALPIDLDEDIGDVGIMIARLGLKPSAMPAAAFVAIYDDQPTCAEPGEDPLALEPATGYSDASWEAPSTMQVVYDDDNPKSREAWRYTRTVNEMLVGYARATGITLRNLCALFEIKNPIIVDRMERASPALNLNATLPPGSQATAPADATATLATAASTLATTSRRCGCVLPAWMYAPAPTRQQLIDSGVSAVMNGYVAAADWMTL
ncbi:unnamed protein product [Closterium sp. Yama58-4]|nr:unnamed protein product [Closterium sp. Yama58-4]